MTDGRDTDKKAGGRRFSHIVARAWADDEFRKRLAHEPEAVLADYQIRHPKGTKVRIVENTPDVIHLVLPVASGDPVSSSETLSRSANGQRLSAIIDRAHSDEAFRTRLLATPHETCVESGMEVPAGATVKFLENTPDLVHFILPVKPSAPSHLALTEMSAHVHDPASYCDGGPCDCGTQK